MKKLGFRHSEMTDIKKKCTIFNSLSIFRRENFFTSLKKGNFALLLYWVCWVLVVTQVAEQTMIDTHKILIIKLWQELI